MSNEFQSREQLNKIIDLNLKEKYKKHIGCNLMLNIKNKIVTTLGDDIFHYFQDFSSLFKNEANNRLEIENEICRYIIGYHTFNCLDKTKEEENQILDDQTYIETATSEIIDMIKIRPYVGSFIRRVTPLAGDEFVYYPTTYYLLALFIKLLNGLNGKITKNNDLFYLFVNKGIGVINTLNDNLLDDLYGSLRPMLEIFYKIMLISTHPEIEEYYKEFTQKYTLNDDDEFIKARTKELRKKKGLKNVIYPDYKNFGFVEKIEDYFNKGANVKYFGIEYIKNYICEYYKGIENGDAVATFIDNTYSIYKDCHRYLHGNIGRSNYTLIHYFDATLTTQNAILVLCLGYSARYDISLSINDINLHQKNINYLVENLIKYKKVRSDNNLFNKYNDTIKNRF